MLVVHARHRLRHRSRSLRPVAVWWPCDDDASCPSLAAPAAWWPKPKPEPEPSLSRQRPTDRCTSTRADSHQAGRAGGRAGGVLLQSFRTRHPQFLFLKDKQREESDWSRIIFKPATLTQQLLKYAHSAQDVAASVKDKEA